LDVVPSGLLKIILQHIKNSTMSQSLVKNYVHLIFSTKHRQPLIIESIENELFNYLGGVCKDLECQPIIVGGYLDHVHILCMLSKKIALMKLLQEIKQNSSKWIKTKDETLHNFYWQDGYGAFSISPANVDIVANYIATQKKHHKIHNFQDEYRGFLNKNKIEYDEKYVWD
jgi:putative transposase